MPLMVIDTYISILLQKYRPTKFSVGDQALDVLTEFSTHYYRSAYDVYSALKNSQFKRRGSKIDYKNTHKRVKRLESLEFIEPVKVEEVNGKKVQHGAIYYRITEIGMFQWFLHRNMLPLLPTVLEIHGNYSIFETLLYPCFKKETLVALKKILDDCFSPEGAINIDIAFEDVNFQIFDAIHRYLLGCCLKIFHAITYVTEEKISLKSVRISLDNQLTILKNDLFMKILLWFSIYDEEKQMDAVAILAKDDKFMNKADDIQRDFKKGFDIAMYLRTRS